MRILIVVIIVLLISVAFAGVCLLCSGGFAYLWLQTASTPQVLRPTVELQPRPPTELPRLTPTRPASSVPPVSPPATPVVANPGPAGETERLLWQTNLPPRDLYDLAVRYKGVSGPLKRVVNDTTPQWQVGDRTTFWVLYHNPDRYGQVQATLRYISPHICAWVEDGQEVDEDDLKATVDLFEARIYHTNRNFFGSEWTPGVDNDPHLHILNASIPGIGGYYWSADEYPRAVFPYSNEREMFHCNLGSAGPGEDYYNATLAHEFQHMIHWHNDSNEDGWVNEGFSELAAYLNGFPPGSEFYFLLQPDTQLNTWSDPEVAGPHYGASYLFMVYFLERFGAQTTQALVAEKQNGIAGFNAVLKPLGLTFDDLFADWVIANYLDDPNLADGRYGYKKLDIEHIKVSHHSKYPVHESAQVNQYGTNYIELTGQGQVTISFRGQTTVPVVGGPAHSGQYIWWSNRGDSSDATLTRAFDLRGLSKATLNFWAWYDIEENWDFAYVAISSDGGQGWKILRGPSTTDVNPLGLSYGWGYTGKSGGGKKPRWIEERIDLTPYVGQQVLIRFEYITDDALNYPGLLLDDIRIPELGYSHDAESGDDGWQAAGFVRLVNALPQRYIVQVVEKGPGGTRVRRMELDAAQQGRMTVNLTGQTVTLVISGAMPFTTEPAQYEYAVKPAP